MYLSLGADKRERVIAYQALFSTELDKESMKKIGDAWITGTPLGSDVFKEQIEMTLARKVGQDRRGRPKKGL